MKLDKRSTFSLFLLLIAWTVSAQKIVVKSDVIDCGQVLYRTPVTLSFSLKNKWYRELHCTRAETSSSAVSVECPPVVVGDDDDFTVNVTYDAKQMGRFEKAVYLYHNLSDEPLKLIIKGIVVGELTAFEGDYPFRLGNIKADMNNIEFDNVNKGDMPMQEIHIMNASSKTVQPVAMHLPEYIKAEVSPSMLSPGHAGVVRITLDSHLLYNMGLTQTSIYLGEYPGDRVSSAKEISISTVLLPSFTDMTEAQRAFPPKIQLSSDSLNLGGLSGKGKGKGEIMITNTGKSCLDISNIQMFTTGMTVSLSRARIEPDESAELKISVDAKQLKSARSKPRVLMITNDPAHPKVTIWVNIN